MNSGRLWEVLMGMLEEFHAGTLDPKKLRQMRDLLKAFQSAARVEQTMSTVRLQDANAMKAIGIGQGPTLLPPDQFSQDIDAEYTVDA